jgi:hypothetical protein
MFDDMASSQRLDQHLHPNGLHFPYCSKLQRYLSALLVFQ